MKIKIALVVLIKEIILVFFLWISILQTVIKTIHFNLFITHTLFSQIPILQLLLTYQHIILYFKTSFFKFDSQFFWVCCAIKIHPQFQQDLVKGMILFLHFLMVTATLLSFTGHYEAGHILEYFICSSEILKNEMATMNLQKPMISLVLLCRPMPFLDILFLFFRCLHLDMTAYLLRLFFVLFSSQSNMALFSEERLKVISGNNLLILRIGNQNWCSGGRYIHFWSVNRLSFNGQNWYERCSCMLFFALVDYWLCVRLLKIRSFHSFMLFLNQSIEQRSNKRNKIYLQPKPLKSVIIGTFSIPKNIFTMN